MKTLPLATNAKEVLDARMQGFRPADMIVVSLVGKVSIHNHTVLASPEKAYDWRWTHGLDVCVYINEKPVWADLVRSIAIQRPEHLSIWNVSGLWGAKVYLIPTAADLAKPVRDWEYELDFLPWLDFQNHDFAESKNYEGAAQ